MTVDDLPRPRDIDAIIAQAKAELAAEPNATLYAQRVEMGYFALAAGTREMEQGSPAAARAWLERAVDFDVVDALPLLRICLALLRTVPTARLAHGGESAATSAPSPPHASKPAESPSAVSVHDDADPPIYAALRARLFANADAHAEPSVPFPVPPDYSAPLVPLKDPGSRNHSECSQDSRIDMQELKARFERFARLERRETGMHTSGSWRLQRTLLPSDASIDMITPLPRWAGEFGLGTTGIESGLDVCDAGSYHAETQVRGFEPGTQIFTFACRKPESDGLRLMIDALSVLKARYHRIIALASARPRRGVRDGEPEICMTTMTLVWFGENRLTTPNPALALPDNGDVRNSGVQSLITGHGWIREGIVSDDIAPSECECAWLTSEQDCRNPRCPRRMEREHAGDRLLQF